MNEDVKTTSFNRCKLNNAVKKLKNELKKGTEKAKAFAAENKEIFAAAGLLIGLRLINRATSAKEQDKELSKWDPVAGVYWPIRRPMTLSEKRYYAEQVRAGVPRDVVLEKLRLLK